MRQPGSGPAAEAPAAAAPPAGPRGRPGRRPPARPGGAGRSWRLALPAIGMAGAILAAGCAAPAPRPFTPGLLLGAYPGAGGLRGFDRQVGHAALAVSYVRWGTPVAELAALVAATARQSAEAVLELEPGAYGHDASQIAAGGSSDAWLGQLGLVLASVGRPVAISFFPEMNGPWHARWSEGPASYVLAYRHVHRVLSRLAGTLITWFWQCAAIHRDTPDPLPWWPGRRWVDVAAMDSYYYYQDDDFTRVFGATIRLIRERAPTVPVMIGETAAGPLFRRQAWEIGDI